MSDDEKNGFRGHEDMRVPLPLIFPKIKIPQLFIVNRLYETDNYLRDANGRFQRKKVAHKSRSGKITYTMEKVKEKKMGWFVINTENKIINKTRNISSRKGHKLLDLQVSKVDKIEEKPHYIPRLADFPEENDRRTIYNYLTHLHPNEIMDFPHNKTRGLPPILPKNWKHHNLGALPKGYKSKKEKEVSHEDIFGSDSESDENPESDSESEPPTPKKKSPAKKVIPLKPYESESDEDAPSPKASKQRATPSQQGGAGGGKGRGRPRKHMTAQEAYDAKIKSNKDKRAERAKEARREKIKEKLAKGEKLTKKERELHEAEGGGLKEDTLKNYGMVLKHLEGHITDPKEPIDPRDYLQSNKIIKEIKKIKSKGGTLKSSVAKGDEGIDFEDINWGTFKALYNRFLKKNPDFKDKIEDLEHFAHFVVCNPDKFSKIAHKKALFYQNILEHKK